MLKIKNLVLGSNLESVIYTLLTDSKLLLYGQESPMPWETTEESLWKYLTLWDRPIFRKNPLFHMMNDKEIYPTYKLYRHLLHLLHMDGKCFSYKAEKIKFSNNRLSCFIERKNNSVNMEYENLILVNHYDFDNNFIDLITSVDDSKTYTVFDTFKYYNEPHELEAFKTETLNLKFPEKYIYYGNENSCFVTCFSKLTEEEFNNDVLPPISEIFTRFITVKFPSIVKQRNTQRAYKGIDPDKIRNIFRDVKFTYGDLDNIKFLYLEREKLISFLKANSKIQLSIYDF
jgi:hypothetical protein